MNFIIEFLAERDINKFEKDVNQKLLNGFQLHVQISISKTQTGFQQDSHKRTYTYQTLFCQRLILFDETSSSIKNQISTPYRLLVNDNITQLQGQIQIQLAKEFIPYGDFCHFEYESENPTGTPKKMQSTEFYQAILHKEYFNRDILYSSYEINTPILMNLTSKDTLIKK
jgi:hypothetical protein